MVEKTRLGQTDLEVNRPGYGAMNLSLEGRPSEEESIEVLHRVLDLGYTFIDTADAYCIDEAEKHHNERLIAKAFAQYDGYLGDVVVATKGGLMRPTSDRWVRRGDPDHIREAVRESYEALGGEPIQLWQHHAPDPEVPIEESLEAAREMQDEGLIQHIGVSNYSVEHLERAREVTDIESVQNKYNPWYRRPEESGVLAYCEDEGLTFIAYSPLGGTDRAKSLDEYEGLAEMAHRKDISPQRLVLAWLMAKSPVVVPIPGATRTVTAEDSWKAVDVQLSDDEVKQIDHATAAVL